MASYDEAPNIESGPEDLLAEAAAGLQSDTDAEVLAEAAEILTAERVSLGIVDRLSVAQGQVTMTLRSGCRVEGIASDVGDQVVVLAGVDGAEQCIAIASVVTIRGLPSSLSNEHRSNEPRSSVTQRGQEFRRPAVGALTWGSFLRAEPASEAHVILIDGTAITGRLALVGADHVDLLVADGSVTTCALSAISRVIRQSSRSQRDGMRRTPESGRTSG
jgi:hypothetical protein